MRRCRRFPPPLLAPLFHVFILFICRVSPSCCRYMVGAGCSAAFIGHPSRAHHHLGEQSYLQPDRVKRVETVISPTAAQLAYSVVIFSVHLLRFHW